MYMTIYLKYQLREKEKGLAEPPLHYPVYTKK